MNQWLSDVSHYVVNVTAGLIIASGVFQLPVVGPKLLGTSFIPKADLPAVVAEPDGETKTFNVKGQEILLPVGSLTADELSILERDKHILITRPMVIRNGQNGTFSQSNVLTVARWFTEHVVWPTEEMASSTGEGKTWVTEVTSNRSRFDACNANQKAEKMISLVRVEMNQESTAVAVSMVCITPLPKIEPPEDPPLGISIEGNSFLAPNPFPSRTTHPIQPNLASSTSAIVAPDGRTLYFKNLSWEQVLSFIQQCRVKESIEAFSGNFVTLDDGVTYTIQGGGTMSQMMKAAAEVSGKCKFMPRIGIE